MPRTPKLLQIDEEERFLARVAWAYYVEEMTQGDVAEKLGVTRLRVNRALSEARRIGLVRITFDTAFAPCIELEKRLCARYALSRAYVAPTPDRVEDVQTMVGAALGHLLSEELARPEIRLFGMSWGGTLNIATRFFAPVRRPDLEIVSVMGGLTQGSDLNSFEITTRLADLCDARHSYFTAPLYAGSAEARETIMALDVFAAVVDKIRSADALAMAAGDISKRSLLMRDGLPTDVSMEELREAGAVGDVLGFVLDAEGNELEHPINERVIGVRIDDLLPLSNVILAAGAPWKAPIIRAVLKRGVVDTLVTDAETARVLMEVE